MGKRVLLIEDDEQNRYLFRVVLEKKGFDVVQARDGPEGLDKAREKTPDLVLLDIGLPEIDGYEVMKRLMALPELRDVPVLALTAYATEEHRDRILEAGFSQYITKPVVPDKFIQLISSYLR